jgi:hypothetical protein
MLFAFSRDDGVPGSRWLKKVSTRFRTPSGLFRSPSRCISSPRWEGRCTQRRFSASSSRQTSRRRKRRT